MQSDTGNILQEEIPLNVSSTDNELIAREISNFEECPFALDGRKFQSVEGFYVWLKFFDDKKNSEMAMTLYGPEAKNFGRNATASVVDYNGKKIVLGSDEHHGLIKRAIRAKLEQHPDIARRFAATCPRPIIHDLGVSESASRFPATVFTAILTDLRRELVEDILVTRDGPVSTLAAAAAQAEKRRAKLPISEQLLLLEGTTSAIDRPIKRYAQALQDSGILVSSFLGAGGRNLAFLTPKNEVLKVTTHVLPNQFSQRQFHLHIFDMQKIDAGHGLLMQLYKQPKGTAPLAADLKIFNRLINRLGWVLADGGLEQLSIYNGGVKLHDPLAVKQTPGLKIR